MPTRPRPPVKATGERLDGGGGAGRVGGGGGRAARAPTPPRAPRGGGGRPLASAIDRGRQVLPQRRRWPRAARNPKGAWGLREHRPGSGRRRGQPPPYPRRSGRRRCSPRLATHPLPREVRPHAASFVVADEKASPSSSLLACDPQAPCARPSPLPRQAPKLPSSRSRRPHARSAEAPRARKSRRAAPVPPRAGRCGRRAGSRTAPVRG